MPKESTPGRPTPLPEFSVHSGDPNEAEEVGGRVYYPHRVDVLGDSTHFAMTIEAASVGPLTLGWLIYDTEVRIQTGDLGRYHVNIPTGGTMVAASGGESVASGPGTAHVYRPDRGADFTGWASPAPMLALKIDRRALEHELEILLDRPINGPIDFDLALDVSTGRGAQWWSLVRALATDLADENSLVRQPMVAAPFTHSVMTGLLMSAKHGLRHELAVPVAAAGVSVVRTARAFIEENADQPITIADIARAVGVGIRGLQHGFQRSLDVSPSEYLRHVRLRRVHEDLLAADPAMTTVGQVAARWGFPHQGRFAGQYRERYGVQPGETLRRRP